MISLIEPTLQYKESFLEGVREFQNEGRLLAYNLKRLTVNFEAFLQQERRLSDPATMGPNHVPSCNFWLVNGKDYIGLVSLRLGFNDFILKVAGNIGYQIRPSWRGKGYGKLILRLGLNKARELGLPYAFVTCDENNIASKKVIEHNGGHFENAIAVEGSPIKKLRYRFQLT